MPQRRCAACRAAADQRGLLRVGSDAQGSVGPEVRGRGAYVCRNEKCVREGFRSRRVQRALRAEGRPVDWAEIEAALLQTITNTNAKD